MHAHECGLHIESFTVQYCGLIAHASALASFCYLIFVSHVMNFIVILNFNLKIRTCIDILA